MLIPRFEENIFDSLYLYDYALAGDLGAVQFLIAMKANINNQIYTPYSRTPLHAAAANGHLEVVKFLIENGADIYLKDKHLKTALDAAVNNSHLEVVQFLKTCEEKRPEILPEQSGAASVHGLFAPGYVAAAVAKQPPSASAEEHPGFLRPSVIQ